MTYFFMWGGETGFPGGSVGKESACNAGDLGLTPRWGRNTPVFLPGKSHGQRSLAGYSPWGCKGSNISERLSIIQRNWNAALENSVNLVIPWLWDVGRNSEQQRHQWFIGQGILCVWSKRFWTNVPLCTADGRQDMAAVFTTRGRRRLPVVRLAPQLPGKSAARAGAST